MALETAPPGVVSDGNVLVLFVPTIADPTAPTATELTAQTVVPLTYSGSGDGYKHDVTINDVTINRFTMKQSLTEEGTTDDKITYTYVYTNTVSDVALTALPEDTVGYIVERWAVPNAQVVAADDVVDVVPFKAGIPKKDAPTTNQELTRTQNLNVTGTVNRDVSVVSA